MQQNEMTKHTCVGLGYWFGLFVFVQVEQERVSKSK